ncbi:hypothetical protein [Mesorhizobium sp. M1378]|uniref:hypothetical protein n=1 Tax=Mesorhizobium sp. M1378 TaxID=2957092 RepID=UPI00333C7D5E
MSVIGDKCREAATRLRERQRFVPAYKVRRAEAVAPPLAVPPEDAYPPPPAWIEPSLRDALAAMTNREYCQSTFFSAQQMRADYEGAHPVILEFSRLLVKRLRVLNVPMYAHAVWRTQAAQTEAFVRGVSKVKWPNSAHNHGCAVDIVHGFKHWALTKDQWQIIGHVGFEIARQNSFKLTWGGDDPGVDDAFNWDPAHWELADWRSHKVARPD